MNYKCQQTETPSLHKRGKAEKVEPGICKKSHLNRGKSRSRGCSYGSASTTQVLHVRQILRHIIEHAVAVCAAQLQTQVAVVGAQFVQQLVESIVYSSFMNAKCARNRIQNSGRV